MVDVTSAAKELVFGQMAVEEAGVPIGGTPPQVEHWSDAVAPKPYAAGGTETEAATRTMSWSIPGNDSRAIGGVEG